jgi:hypothetical protein
MRCSVCRPQSAGGSRSASSPPAGLPLPCLALALLAAALLHPLPLAAQLSQTAVVQEILDGKELFIDREQARIKQQARSLQLISTGKSRGQLAFDGGAVGRLNRQSQLRLGSTCFLLDKGQVLVSGKQGGCTRSARLSVRGTNYVLEVTEVGDTKISLLEGEVEVQASQEGEALAETQPTTLLAGQRLRISREGVVLAILALSSGDYTRIITGPLFEGFKLPLPAQTALESYLHANLPSVPISSPPTGPSLPSFRGFGFGLF